MNPDKPWRLEDITFQDQGGIRRGVIGPVVVVESAGRYAVTMATDHLRLPVHLLEGSAEHIPLEDGSMDTVVMTWTGCSIPAIDIGLQEIRRVLKECGRLLFVEHGRAPEPGIARWQDRLDPFWQRVSGGCHLNRKINYLIVDAGFRIDRLHAGYIPGPSIMTFFYEGAASPR